MKRIMKKNQIIVTTLAIMIAVAGYLTFAKDINKNTKEASTDNEQLVSTDGETETSSDDIWSEEDIIVQGEDETSDVDENSVPGEAVLTQSSTVIAAAKNDKAQVRAQNEAMLQQIIDNANLTEAERTEAINKMVAIATNSEMETAAETLLQAKGFSNVMVSITEGSADVVVEIEDITEAEVAQISDIINRKTGITYDKIVITPVDNSTSDSAE